MPEAKPDVRTPFPDDCEADAKAAARESGDLATTSERVVSGRELRFAPRRRDEDLVTAGSNVSTRLAQPVRGTT